MPANNLAHPLHAAEIDLPAGDRDAIGRGCHRRADHCRDSAAKTWQISRSYRRHAMLERRHVIAEHMPQRRIEGRSESGIEQCC